MQKKLVIPSAIAAIAILAVSFALLQKPAGTEEWQGVQSRIYPQLTRVSTKTILPLVYTEFTKDLDIGYVIDKETSYDFIMQENLARWSVTKDDVHKAAMKNLEKLANDTTFDVGVAGENADEHFVIIETTDGYAAARILSPSIRKRIADEIGSPFAAAIPVRDFLIAWPNEFSIGYQFVEQVEKEYKAGGEYKLSSRVHKVTPSDITQL